MLRSRTASRDDVNPRRLGRRTVKSDHIADGVVRRRHLWPGLLDEVAAHNHGPGEFGFDLSALVPQKVTGDPGVPGDTGESSDAGHRHQLDVEAVGEVDAVADTLALRGPTGTVSVAPSAAPEHAIADSQATVAATSNAIARRNAQGQTEVANASTGVHALNRQTGDGRYTEAAHKDNTTDAHGASQAVTADSIARRTSGGQIAAADGTADSHLVTKAQLDASGGGGGHPASVSADPDTVALRDSAGRTSVGDATSSTHVLNRGSADDRYVNLSSGSAFQTMINRLQVPSGSIANPGLGVGASNLGLQSETLNNLLAFVTQGAVRARISAAGLRPGSSGMSLGLIGTEWGTVRSNGLIHTTGSGFQAPNGSLTVGTTGGTPGSVVARGGEVYAESSTFAIRGRGVAAVSGGTGLPDGVTVGAKSNGRLRVRTDYYFGWEQIEHGGLINNSDARGKAQIRDNDHDDLADVLATKTSRFRRRKHRPRDGVTYESRLPKTGPPPEWEEYLSEEQVGWLANNVTPDVAMLMGGQDGDGFEVGIALEQQLAKLWHAFQQSHIDHERRLAALESR